MPKDYTKIYLDSGPVQFLPEDWPVVAESVADKYDSEFVSQANRSQVCVMRIRQHADGRVLAYATYEYDTRFQGESCLAARVGRLLEAEDVDLTNIRATLLGCAKELRNNLSDKLTEYGGIYSPVITQAYAELIEDFPALCL